ncbi:MAG: phosphoribosylaminoimidazolesuccinocarboxamide synthase [Acidimicrobiales bacterium]
MVRANIRHRRQPCRVDARPQRADRPRRHPAAGRGRRAGPSHRLDLHGRAASLPGGERVLYGYTLPDGLTPHGPLPEPIVTPTTKAADGEHDEPITVAEVAEQGLVEPALWKRIQQVALDLFARGAAIADAAGFVLADTKYEFGLGPDGELLLIDEMHTPDSSRYWAKDTLDERLANGQAPDGYDKEPVRLALKAAGYHGDGQPPELPPEVWEQTSARYVELYERLTGRTFVPGAQPAQQRILANLSELVSHE